METSLHIPCFLPGASLQTYVKGEKKSLHVIHHCVKMVKKKVNCRVTDADVSELGVTETKPGLVVFLLIGGGGH